MHDELHDDPVKLLRKRYEAKAKEILEIEREGDLQRLLKLLQEQDDVQAQLQAADRAADRS